MKGGCHCYEQMDAAILIIFDFQLILYKFINEKLDETFHVSDSRPSGFVYWNSSFEMTAISHSLTDQF